MEKNKVYNMDCIEGMKLIENDSIDCIITSPPYNVGIEYDSWNDRLPFQKYLNFTKEWITEAYRILKRDGRIAINIPYEVNMMEHGGRILLVSEYYSVMKSAGFNFSGIVDLNEKTPERVKLTAWGSWLSPSSPYIYNPKECIILGYKEKWKKENKGKSYFNERNKKEFQNLVYGQWNYVPEMRGLTKANFSYDIPLNCLKILTFENELILDPFMGSGTTAECCIRLNRQYIGFEISKNYCETMKQRINQRRLSGNFVY